MTAAPSERMPIRLADIARSSRLRPVDHAQALLIASSMGESGLRTPIEVRVAPKKSAQPYVLVIGGHRCEAAAILGWETIDAIVVDLTADEARLREIDENLYRAELNALDQAVFLAERKAIYERLHPETKHGGDRRSDQAAIFGDLVANRFTDEVKDRLGLSERSVQRILQRARIADDVRTSLAGTKTARTGSELDALARLEPAQQRAVVGKILADPVRAPTVSAALAAIEGARREAPKPAADLQYEALLKAWKAAGSAARERFTAYLQQSGALAAGED